MANPLQRVLDRLPKARRYRQTWRTQCPLHGGKSRDSLSVKETADGTVLLHCWGGCETASIVRHLGLDMQDLFPEREASRPRTRPKVTHRKATTTTPWPYPQATASTLYAATYLGAILADELPPINRDETMGTYLQLCEVLGRVYVDEGYDRAQEVWRTWIPTLQQEAPELLAMIERTKGACA